MPQRTPRPSEISAALAALGVYAQAPTDDELEQQAIAAGGENVLAAVLANALYGASIGCGMLAEGQMLEQPTNRAQRLSLARAQALKAAVAAPPPAAPVRPPARVTPPPPPPPAKPPCGEFDLC